MDRRIAIPLAAALAWSAPASGAIVHSDDFDTENGGATALDYAAFANWNVQPFLGPNSAVDIVDGTNNAFGISCGGICVDLDGSTGVGGLISTKDFFSFNAGDRVTLSVDISGNQRGGSENYILGFLLPIPVDLFEITLTDPLGSESFPNEVGLAGTLFGGDIIPFDRPFGRYSFSFLAGSAGVFAAGIGTDSMDSAGPLIDNVSIDVSPVPEPATWAMLITSLGIAGGVARRRRGS